MIRYGDVGAAFIAGDTVYGYDASDRLTGIVSQDHNGATIDSRAYSYDSADRLTSETDNGTTTNYAYDLDSQLISAGSTGYGYDANGNRNVGASIGADNQLLSDGTWTYQYDADGNLIQKSSTSTVWQYSYDVGGQLVSASEFAVDSSGGAGTGGGGIGGTGGGTGGGGGGTGGGTLVLQSQVDYAYDAMGRLVSRQVVSYSSDTPTTTELQNLSYDGQSSNVLFQLNGLNGNAPQIRYLYSDQEMTAPVVSIGGATAVTAGKTWYITDHLGSVVATAGGGAAIFGGDNSTTTYDAFGNIIAQTGVLPSDFYYGYTGSLFDSITGEQYHNARWYDSESGRWLSQDPLGFSAGDNNLYRYVGNGPTDGTDPTGEYLITKEGRGGGLDSGAVQRSNE